MGTSRWSRRRHLKRKLTMAIKHLDRAGALIWASAQEFKEHDKGPYEALEVIASAVANTIEALEPIAEEV